MLNRHARFCCCSALQCTARSWPIYNNPFHRKQLEAATIMIPADLAAGIMQPVSHEPALHRIEPVGCVRPGSPAGCVDVVQIPRSRSGLTPCRALHHALNFIARSLGCQGGKIFILSFLHCAHGSEPLSARATQLPLSNNSGFQSTTVRAHS